MTLLFPPMTELSLLEESGGLRRLTFQAWHASHQKTFSLVFSSGYFRSVYALHRDIASLSIVSNQHLILSPLFAVLCCSSCFSRRVHHVS